MPVQTQQHKVDYLFAGAGASATLLLMSMERRGLLQGKTILILDPSEKTKNDRTFCFWGVPDQEPASYCPQLISHQWASVSIDRTEPETLLPMQYLHISGLDLYHELRRIVEKYSAQRAYEAVQSLESTENGVFVKTDNNAWFASAVFDSRPPKYQQPKENEAHLFQSFIGYVIQTNTFNEVIDHVDLMDFDVEQHGYTQFIYVLPFGPNKMLVELTRFGKALIDPKEAEAILVDYIKKRYGAYQILDTEVGCIPMSNAEIAVKSIAGVVNIGGRAGAIKPSTGYAFKNMLTNAEVVAESLQKGIKAPNYPSSVRFSFYDRLLLLILYKQPTEGKRIFQTLFRKNSTTRVLQFLDEKTTIYQDLHILLSLPLKPFLQALWYDTTIRLKSLITPLLLLLLSLVLLVLNRMTAPVFNIAQFVLLGIGLFSVGIPHGALDHLLESGNLYVRPKISFILKYLAAAAACLGLWLVFPNAALLFFILYSIWHFGQTDMQDWQILNNRAPKNCVWGFCVLSIILFGHINETNLILDKMGVFLMPFHEAQGEVFSIILALIALAWGFIEQRPKMVLSACLLVVSIQLPLITAFGLYFLGQHSINGWSHLKHGLNTSNIPLFMKALPFTAGAFLLFLTLFYGLESSQLAAFEGHLVTTFFVFISCISFPHVIAMNKFYFRLRK
jgi:lycopene beta-cyclase